MRQEVEKSRKFVIASIFVPKRNKLEQVADFYSLIRQ
jgi:hypothetical protein